MNSEHQALAEYLEKSLTRIIDQKLDERFKKVDIQFQRVDIQFAGVDKQFAGVDKQFEGVDKQFEKVDKRFGQIDEQFGRIDEQFKEVNRNIYNLIMHVDGKNDRQDEVAEDHELRISILERDYHILTS